MDEKSNNSENKGKGHNIRIPIISFWLRFIIRFVLISVVAGAVSFCAETFLYVHHGYSLSGLYERFDLASSFNEHTGSWFDEKKIMSYVESNITKVVLRTRKNSIIARAKENYSSILSKWEDNKTVSDITGKLDSWRKQLTSKFPDFITLVILSFLIWVAKILSITSMALPCVLIVIGGMVDGSVTRKIDTYKGKPDSQDKIEWWFLGFRTVSYTLLFVYMAIPSSLSVVKVILPMSLLSAFFIRKTVAEYKKYV